MPTLNPCLPSNSGLSHPNLNSSEELKQLLLTLARNPEYGQHRATLRSAADRVRETAFGYNRSTTKKKILKLLREYECLELVDFTDETKIPENEIRAALDDLAARAIITRGKRRRWQEPGKHYNDIFYLTKSGL